MPKKIIFDSRWIGEHGIGRFAKEVRNADLPFVNIQLHGNPAGKFDTLKLTFYLWRNKGYYFSPGYNAPFLFLNKTIITIHDLNHIDLNYNSSLLKRLYYKLILKRACKKSALILTVSEFSKERIHQWAKIPYEKIRVVGNGVSPEFVPEGSKYYNNSLPYILIVGNRKVHKNEPFAVSAFLKANISKEYRLLVIGDNTEELKEIISTYNASERVVFLGRVSNAELASLYRGATCLLFPSLYEGFGLPVIESMACGTPVITSYVTSLPEIAGDAAIMVNPYEVKNMSIAIEEIVNNINLRQSLIAKGIAQSSKYNWKHVRMLVKESLVEGFNIK
ncbi:TPA: glycosyltransferase family 4 protein [Klebsiella variicola subsp. variicola]|uniref:glycosyltransferase family 4 protein n=1 Tax=Klebsiella variicola TaxID=244366 RepID=UPI0027F746C1|nr:glycosyltransferase family 1 protein [Klebsiella variicola]HDU4298230.1 glycosyltransferase family 4 protein [Klebsiella variicola]